MESNTYQDNLNTNEKMVISNQEITARKWKFESIFKVIAGIIYGLFFGMLPASFNFGATRVAFEPSPIEICGIVGLMVIGIFSIIIIFWLFKGDIKKSHPIWYMTVHLINSILLSIGILLSTILYPNFDDVNRYLILAIAYFVWAIVMMAVTSLLLWKYKNQFPLSWSRIPYALFSIIFMSLIEFFIYLAANAQINQQMYDQALLFEIISLGSLIISVLVFGFGIAFVKRFRDVLLGERTDNEIETIRDWESARISSLIISSVVILTYAISLIFRYSRNTTGSSTDQGLLSMPMYIELAVDLLLVIPYIVLISFIKVKNAKKSAKGFFASKVFKTIDNGLLLDVFAWIIIVKTILIEGILLTDGTFLGNATNGQKSFIIALSFVSVLVLYAFSIIVQINVPNLRNTAVSLSTIVFAILLLLFIILFAGFLQSENLISKYVFIVMPLFVLFGSSISLIIKISMIAKIFRTNTVVRETINESYLSVEDDETEESINQRSEKEYFEKRNNKEDNFNFSSEGDNKKESEAF